MELNPLNQIDLVTIALTISIFIATYWIMRKVFFDKTVAVMETREQRCLDAEAACQRAQTIVAEAEQRAEDLLVDTREEADGVVARAREKAEEEKSARIALARQKAEQRLQEGRAEILAAREREINSLRAEATECVGLACEKLAGTADPDVVDGVVDRLVAKTLQ